MNTFEAKKILQLYRPDNADADDQQIAAALQLARREPELGNWLEQHNRFQTAMREKLLEIPVPTNLKEMILAEKKIVRPLPWWSESALLRVAALIILLIAVGFGVHAVWKKSHVPDRFTDYRSRMVRSAIREYQMDFATGDLNQLRQWIATQGAPADFAVPPGLSGLQLSGGGVLRWRNNPVAMACFHRGDNEMVFLFVMDRSATKDPPPPAAELGRVSKFVTASWSDGDKTYLLTGPEEADFLQKYF